jgi:hypothetical protein
VAKLWIYNQNQWSAIGAGVDSSVRAIGLIGTDVYVGGKFLTIDGITVNGIAKWNGACRRV